MENARTTRVAVGHPCTGLEPASHQCFIRQVSVALGLASPHLLAATLGQFGRIYSMRCRAQ